MRENVKEKQKGLAPSKEVVQEIKLPLGKILVLEDGQQVYVIPIAQLSKMKEKDLTNIKLEIKARELVKQAHELTLQRLREGWAEEDFQRDFLEVQEKIAQFLSKQRHA
ncbi:MAG: hypothetical protein HY731_08160 [Candidatus Tectomicrobia bacterium]|nr:hypothetical protein [Candidatus Tectomicrobia bacterium]